MIALCMLSSFAGFGLLCLGMSRHQRELFGRLLSPQRTRVAKTAGWSLVALSYVGAMLVEGAAPGAVYGFGVLTFGALAVALTVTAKTRQR